MDEVAFAALMTRHDRTQDQHCYRSFFMNDVFTPIVLCADGYAHNSHINAAVLDLLEKKRITAVSCFTTAPEWKYAAQALHAYGAQADMGLHFNLTEGFGRARVPGLHTVILRSLLRGVNGMQVRQTLERQLDAFEDALGHGPDFLDSHQHVHQLPGVRQIMLQVLKQRYPERAVWVRNTVPADASWRGKPHLLKLLGGQVTADHLRYEQVPTNDGFAGVYDGNRTDYDSCFAAWLAVARAGMLIMCHPAAAQRGHKAITRQHMFEYDFLRSYDCARMLDSARVRLAKLSVCYMQAE